MSNFRILDDALSASLAEMPQCLVQIVSKLKSEIQAIEANSSISNRSESLKSALTSQVNSVNWNKKSLFDAPELADAPAIFKLDGISVCNELCGSYHQANIVICLNNREIIGTNFLKLEVAAIEAIRNHPKFAIYDKNILGVLVTLDENLLRTGNWDRSYASSDEYKFAFKHAYKGVLKANIISMQLHIV
jgi:metal-responsive CopG/Arc/MetJ family transcriptional regulator